MSRRNSAGQRMKSTFALLVGTLLPSMSLNARQSSSAAAVVAAFAAAPSSSASSARGGGATGSTGAEQGGEDSNRQHKQQQDEIPLLPAVDPDSAKDLPSIKLGESIKFDEMGPIILNADGTTRRIDNWDEMTDREREVTWRRISKRNEERRKALLEQQQQQQAEQPQQRTDDESPKL